MVEPRALCPRTGHAATCRSSRSAGRGASEAEPTRRWSCGGAPSVWHARSACNDSGGAPAASLRWELVGARQRTLDDHDALGEVDVTPRQCDQLALPQSGVGGDATGQVLEHEPPGPHGDESAVGDVGVKAAELGIDDPRAVPCRPTRSWCVGDRAGPPLWHRTLQAVGRGTVVGYHPAHLQGLDASVGGFDLRQPTADPAARTDAHAERLRT